MQLLRKLLGSYVVILLTALSVGLAFPTVAQKIAPLSTLFLQIIFFLSSLKLDLRTAKSDARHWRVILISNLYMLVLLPIATYLVTKILLPTYALPLLILAAMPAGMTSMLLTELIGGSVNLALLLTMSTSLLAPFTIPFVMKLLAGTTVSVPTADMMWSLLKVIVVPFLLAQIVRLLWHEKIRASFFIFKPISMVLLGLLITGIVGKKASNIVPNLATFLPALAILAGFFLLLHLAGYFGLPGLNRPERLAASVCLTYMNFTLAIYLAGKYFPDPYILIPVILSVFPWSLGMIPFQIFLKYYSRAK